MSLTDRLHCPDCQSRLGLHSPGQLRCAGCERQVPLIDGIAHFYGGPALVGSAGRASDPWEFLAVDLPSQIKVAAAGRWPVMMGDTIEFARGGLSMIDTHDASEIVRSLLVLDPDPETLRASQARIAAGERRGQPAAFAAVDTEQNVIRDAVADTVLGGAALTNGNVRAVLSTVYRALKPSGQAMFVVPNRRHRKAVCLTLAESVTQHFGQFGAWPDHSAGVMTRLAESRLHLVHHEDSYLFDSDALMELCGEIGFATTEVIPLDPDPTGAETIVRIGASAGVPESFGLEFGPLAATVGRPFFGLLSYPDTSSHSLLWLTKAVGPAVRVFSPRVARRPITYRGPAAALGGAPPRWSVELLGRDTPEGVVVKVGGWCLSNIDAGFVRIVLDGNVQRTPVWRYRPDVHDVLNRAGMYHPLNALFSGIDDELLFPGLHSVNGLCPLRVDVLLDGDLSVSGDGPENLIIDEPMVIAH